MGMRDDLSGAKRMEKCSDPARRPMIWSSHFLPSLGPYAGIVKLGVGLRLLRRLIMVGEISCVVFGVVMWCGPDGTLTREE